VTRASTQLRMPRLSADGMPVSRFARWMTLFGSNQGGHLVNHVFGRIRLLRSELAYWPTGSFAPVHMGLA
jgi:hypothetical protein